MGVIYLTHPQFGAKTAIVEEEAVADEANGWSRYDVPAVEPVVEPAVEPVVEPAVEPVVDLPNFLVAAPVKRKTAAPKE